MSIITLDFLKKRPLSFSGLKEFLKSPMHFQYYMTTPAKSKKFPPAVANALAMGKLIDILILTPEKFDKMFAVHSYNIYSYSDKPNYEMFCENNKGKIIVTKDDHEKALMISSAVKRNSESKELLSRVKQTQREYRWTDPETELPCMAYTDAEGDNLTVELKSTQNASQKSFEKDAFNFNYPFQTGFYKEGQYACGVLHEENKYIVVEKEAPFGVAVYEPSADYIEHGRFLFKKTLWEFRTCLENDQFDMGYEYWSKDGKALKLDLPAWAKKKY